jgi:catechol 2,3-dioxygenase-like lactoylglutathione lyase family enzyme
MMNDTTPPARELFVTQFLVVSDQDRSRDFYQSVFGADVLRDRDPVILALANTRIVLNIGGGPADDKPAIQLAPPPTRVSPADSRGPRVVRRRPAPAAWPGLA